MKIKNKTLKISELIKALEFIIKESGDLPIFMSSDEEGNSYGTITKESFSWNKKAIIIYPYISIEDSNFV